MSRLDVADVGFARRLVAWQRKSGRHDLPWQNTRDPYVIWVAEIMLQQTQVKTVIPYFNRFMARFPDVRRLADADEESVLIRWSGLGYYARARNLHKAAGIIAREHGGVFPCDFDTILSLPGVGRSTAAAICACAFGARRAILDGNVKRVLSRCFGVTGYPGDKVVENRLWGLAEALLPKSAKAIGAYTQAQMDLGATVCTRTHPLCSTCPLRNDCIAYREHRIEELPAKKPRRPLPARSTAMLILVSQNEVLLQRRPVPGIWGGLWCFPEAGPEADWLAEARRRFDVSGKRGPKLHSVKHGFTHFELTIHPRVIDVTRRAKRAEQSGLVWMPLQEAEEAAIPAPVRRLLRETRKLF